MNAVVVIVVLIIVAGDRCNVAFVAVGDVVDIFVVIVVATLFVIGFVVAVVLLSLETSL